MSATPIPLATKDNASGRLQSGINASVLSIPLQSGNGANFPQPYTGTATSSGSSTTLNCTGIGSTLSTATHGGKPIWNKTDGSWAIILSVSANSLTCTRLLGGTDNTWDNADVWAYDAFVATFAVLNSSNEITQYEQALVTGRSTDTLSVPLGGRGYNGTTANAFATGDYVYLLVTSPVVERMKDVISVVAQQLDAERTTNATQTADTDNLENGTSNYAAATGSGNAFAVTVSPVPGSYTTGFTVRFQANHTITGTATLNVNSLGAKTIKKGDGSTNLAANDIKSGQIVTVVYDGTNLQLQSPAAVAAAQDGDVLYISSADSNAVTGTSETDLDTKYTLQTAEQFTAAGQMIVFEGFILPKNINGTLRCKFNGVTLASLTVTDNGNSSTIPAWFQVMITCRSTGSGGTVAVGAVLLGKGAATNLDLNCTNPTAAWDTTASADLKLTFQGSGGAGDCKTRNVKVTRFAA